MSSGEHQSYVEKSVPLIYRLQRWFFAASIVLGTAATCVMVQIHLIAAVIAFYLLPVGLVVMAWLAMRRAPWLASSGAFLVLLGMVQLWLQPSSLSPMTSCARGAILCLLPWSSSSITMG